MLGNFSGHTEVMIYCKLYTSLLMLADLVALWQMKWPHLSYAVTDVIIIVIVDRWYIYTCGRCCCLCVLYCGRW